MRTHFKKEEKNMARIIEAEDMFGKKDKFMVIEDIGGPEEMSVGDLELVSIEVKKEGGLLSCGDMRNYARKVEANFGLRHAECFMKAQWRIPEDWKKYDILFFMTTLRRRDNGFDINPYAPLLCWDYHGWRLLLWSLSFPIWRLKESRLIRRYK